VVSEWRWTQLTLAEHQRNGDSLCACIRRKKTFRTAASSSTPRRHSRASWTRSSVKARQIAHGRTICARRPVYNVPSETRITSLWIYARPWRPFPGRILGYSCILPPLFLPRATCEKQRQA
jgi:hypothetical protein